MRIINAHNVNQALAEGLDHLNFSGYREDSRNGPVLVSPEPVTTIYQHPNRRVLMSPLRDANPFFHVMESLWMLGGREDVKFISRYNSNIVNYSDDGKTFHGAYGYRWRRHFMKDQLSVIASMILGDRTTRRAVLAMWDADDDLGVTSLDLPCNTHLYFDTLNGHLNATVCCRSNDVWWGAYGANAVHFSFLLEYMAEKTRLRMGQLRQVSNNFHLYVNVVPQASLKAFADDAMENDPYTEGQPGGRHYQRRHRTPGPALVPLVKTADKFDIDVETFLDDPVTTDEFVDNPFFSWVATPMARAWEYYKRKEYYHALEQCDAIWADDWRAACKQWILRRESARVAGQQT